MKTKNKINLFALLCIIAILAAAGVFAEETAEEKIDYANDPAAVANPNADYSKVNWDVADQSLVPSSRVWEVPVDKINVQQITDRTMIRQEQWAFGSNLNFVDDFRNYEAARQALQEKHPGTALELTAGHSFYKDGYISSPNTPPQLIDKFRTITALPDGTLLFGTGEFANGNDLEGAATYGAEAGRETTTLHAESSLTTPSGVNVENMGQLTQFTESPQETTITGQAFFTNPDGKGFVGSYSDGNDIYAANGAYGQEGASRYGLGTAFSIEQDSGVTMPGSDMMLRAENSRLLTLMTTFASGLQQLPMGSVSSSQLSETAQSSLREIYGPDLRAAAHELKYTLADAVGFGLTDTTQIRSGVGFFGAPSGTASSVLTGLATGDFDIMNLQTNDRTTYFNAGLQFDSSWYRDPAEATHLSFAAGAQSDNLGAVTLGIDATQREATGSASWNVYSLDKLVSVGVSYVHQRDFENEIKNNIFQFGVGAKF